MKLLNEYLTDLLNEAAQVDESLIQECTDWIVNNYKSNYHNDIKPEKVKFAKKLNKDGKLIAKCSGVRTLCLNQDATSVTNGKFVWDDIKGEFSCKFNKNITSLEGCPQEVGELFEITGCDSLTNLEGGPTKCGNYDCSQCEKLESLLGAPKVVDYFRCAWNNKITDLTGWGIGNFCVPDVNFAQCKNLKSLQGGPTCYRTLNLTGCSSLTKYGIPTSPLLQIIYSRLDLKESGVTVKDFELKKVKLLGEVFE